MKNIIFILFLFFLYSCGYTSVYKNQKNQDFQINIKEMEGDKEFNTLIKNELKLYSNVKSNKEYDVVINSKYQKAIISKNSSGVATDYKITVNTIFTVNLDGKTNIYEFNENINIKNSSDSFGNNNYERNIKKNFAYSVREKLINNIFNFK